MINSQINEITAWLDSLEDYNIDVSFPRLLCTHNYLSLFHLNGGISYYYLDPEWRNSRGYGIWDGMGSAFPYDLDRSSSGAAFDRPSGDGFYCMDTYGCGMQYD